MKKYESLSDAHEKEKGNTISPGAPLTWMYKSSGAKEPASLGAISEWILWDLFPFAGNVMFEN